VWQLGGPSGGAVSRGSGIAGERGGYAVAAGVR
jgi:hypothetical protein